MSIEIGEVSIERGGEHRERGGEHEKGRWKYFSQNRNETNLL